jgi:hypothetical protein
LLKEKQDRGFENNQIVLVMILLVLAIAIFNMAFFLKDMGFDITGLVTTPMTLIIDSNQAPIIIINDFIAYVGDLINLDPCAIDPNSDPINCTYSAPINSSGQWQTQEGDAGVYIIEINVSDSQGGNSTKNITLTLTYSECSFNSSRNVDNRSINLAWNFKGKSYTNYTLYWIDTAIEDATINLSLAHNLTINTNEYNDTNASSVGERYYKVVGFNTSSSETCNITVGKYDLNFTPNFGRWNYQSLPFLQDSYYVESILEPGADDLEWAYTYNHSSGLFSGWNFDFDLGTLDNESIYPGECMLVKPKSKWTNVTVTGRIYPMINRTTTNAFGRWNYIGWVAERTPRDEAMNSIIAEYEWLYEYNKSSGQFIGWFQPFTLGDIYELRPGVGYIFKAFDNGTLYYNMYD